MRDASADQGCRDGARGATRDLVERGYALVPALISPHEVARTRSALESLLERIAPPALYAAETLPLERPELPPQLAVTASGLAIPRVLEALPDVRALVMRGPLLDPARQLLGETFRVELLGAAVSDRTRPFFTWHTHIDGEDEGSRFARGAWPVKPRLERLLALVYLNDLDEDAGPLLVLPRRVGEPTSPPYEITAPSWPGQVTLHPRAGDAVLLDECTWHAARSLRTEGLRMFLGCWMASELSRPAPFADPAIAGLARPS